MTVNELIRDLTRYVDEDPTRGDIPVTAANTTTWQFHDIGGTYPGGKGDSRMVTLVVKMEVMTEMPESVVHGGVENTPKEKE